MLAQELYNALEKAVDCGMSLNAEIKIKISYDEENMKDHIDGYYFSENEFVLYWSKVW